jgi:hypothetical protein
MYSALLPAGVKTALGSCMEALSEATRSNRACCGSTRTGPSPPADLSPAQALAVQQFDALFKSAFDPDNSIVPILMDLMM